MLARAARRAFVSLVGVGVGVAATLTSAAIHAQPPPPPPPPPPAESPPQTPAAAPEPASALVPVATGPLSVPAPIAETIAEPVALAAPEPVSEPAAPAPALTASRPPASTRAVPVDVTATMTAGLHVGDLGYGELFGRINASTATGPWSVSLRVDTATFTEPPAPAAIDRYTVEKAWVRWSRGPLELTAGDAYISFGRGLGLSLRKVDELGVDTTLRGAVLSVRRGSIEATAAAGYANVNNVDEATGTSVDDPYDLIAGAQVQARVTDRATVGGYAAGIAFRDSLGAVPGDAYADRSAQLGVTFDAPRLTDRFGVYLEGMGQRVDTEPASGDVTGFALYGSATGYFGEATVLVEGKAYGALTPLVPDLDEPAFSTVAYSSPPTVERVLQRLENPQRDIAGARVRLDWSFSPALLAFASYGAFRDGEGYADPATLAVVPGMVHDPYAGIEARWDEARSWAIATGGWRVVTVSSPGGAGGPGGSEVVRGDGHLDVNVSHALDDRFSLTLHVLHEEREKFESAILDERFREGTIDAGFRVRPWLAVSAGYDYTTEPTQPKRDYFHGNVAWNVTASSSLRLFVGSARGGLRCVSGVCRVVPPFEGVKLVATVRL